MLGRAREGKNKFGKPFFPSRKNKRDSSEADKSKGRGYYLAAMRLTTFF